MADKTIYVSLDKSKNPKVQIDPIVLGRSKIKWRKESDSPDDFDFVNITFLPPTQQSFTVTKLKKDKINVDNALVAGDYEYIVEVEDEDGNPYDSTETGLPPGPGDKPVIRN